MKKLPVFLSLFLSLASGYSVFSKTPDSADTRFILSVQEQLFDDQFDSALSLCDTFIASHSGSPLGYLFKAGTLLGEMSDQEDALYSTKLRKLVDTVAWLCDKGLETSSGPDAAYFCLWKGHAHVYRALFESRFGSFTSAIKHGFRARDDYLQGLRQDNERYDLYFGLGNYHYWKSVKAGILRTIGIISNEIIKGINELRLASDSGLYFQEAARNSMIWIWLDKKDYDSVIVLAENMLKKYPASRTLRWPLAQAYFESGRFEKAAELFLYLYQYFNDNRGNYFNLIECDYQLYRCYHELAQEDKADSVLMRVNEYRANAPKATQRRQLSKLNFLRRELGR